MGHVLPHRASLLLIVHLSCAYACNDLPNWRCRVGEKRDGKSNSTALVYTHKDFVVAYNGDRVIEVNLTQRSPVPLGLGATLTFTYSVSWVPTTQHFAARFNRYLDVDFFEHQIHWFSIFNSFMMVLFLVGLVALILMRTLKSDLHKYRTHADEEDPLGDAPEDTGWKQVQGDVFRFPPLFPLFCGLVGTGIQLILMVYGTTLLSILGTLYVGRGAVSSTAVVVYALSSLASGAVSGRLYAHSRGLAWIKTMTITALGFSSLALLVAAVPPRPAPPRPDSTRRQHATSPASDTNAVGLGRGHDAPRASRFSTPSQCLTRRWRRYPPLRPSRSSRSGSSSHAPSFSSAPSPPAPAPSPSTPHPRRADPPPDPREALVLAALGCHPAWRASAVWVNLH